MAEGGGWRDPYHSPRSPAQDHKQQGEEDLTSAWRRTSGRERGGGRTHGEHSTDDLQAVRAHTTALHSDAAHCRHCVVAASG